jgi:hypothetical protein
MRGAFIILAALVMACSVDDVDYAGKQCTNAAPCPSGYACVAGRCRAGNAPEACVTIDTGAACQGHFSVSNFRRAWATPNAIRWQWDPNGKPEDFVEYKLALSDDSQKLAALISAARAGQTPPGVYDKTTNRELGSYELYQSAGQDPVSGTTADGLAPGPASYLAKLLIVDATGCTCETSAIAADTQQKPSSGDFLVFDEPGASSNGAPRPEADDPPPATVVSATSSSDGYSGSHYISWPGWSGSCTADGGPGGVCWQNVGVTRVRGDLAGLSANFGFAYLELAVRMQSPGAYYDQVWIRFSTEATCASSTKTYYLNGYAIRANQNWQLVQVPLSAFSQLAESGVTTLCDVAVGRGFPLGEAVDIDAVHVFW